MESWPCQWHLVHLKALLMTLLIATFARVLFLKHMLLLLNVYCCHVFCFQRTDWIKKKTCLFLFGFQLLISNHYLFAQLLVSACVLSVQQFMTGNLNMLVSCLPCDSCLPVASGPPNLHTCLCVSTHQLISSLFHLCQKATLEETNLTKFHLTF